MKKPRFVSTRHRSWQKLLKLNREAQARFRGSCDWGLGKLGLIVYSRPRYGGYHCTPLNTLCFAHTGGDGTHFSFLAVNGEVNEKSPVVVTIPTTIEYSNVIVGENLVDFLNLGFYLGYFGMAVFDGGPYEVLNRFTSGTWKATEPHHFYNGLHITDDQRPVMDFLIKRMGLRPWKRPKTKFRALQRRYLPMLELPPRDNGIFP